MRRHVLLTLFAISTCLTGACGDTGSSGATDVSGTPDTTAQIDTTGDTSTVPDEVVEADIAADAGPVTPTPCAAAADGTPCDDGNACTIDDTCSGGVCTGGSNTVCESNDLCRVSGCDPAIGCYTTEQADGSPCAAGCFEVATCQAGNCEVDPATAVACPAPDDPCVDQLQCDPATSECTVAIYKVAGSTCDADENICTEDQCTEAGVCEPTGTVETCAAENAVSPCWTWSCAAKTGCYQTTFVAGVSCDDNNPCTYSDICTVNEFSQELCVGEALPIDDGNVCTDDACVPDDESQPQVIHTFIDGISCDVDACDTPGTCVAGACAPPDSCGCTPVDGGWSEWTLGDCTAECDTGDLFATRTCTDPVPSCGGADCEGEASETQLCAAGDCADGFYCDAGACTEQCTPVPGGWSDWTWGPCSAACGGGVQIGTRTCDNPAPICNGAMCLGDNGTEAPCNTDPCPDGTLPLGKTVYDQPEEVIEGTVPDGVTSMTVSLWGGGGGGGFPGIGGGGAWVQGTLAVQPGDAVELRVAGGGTNYGGGGGASYVFLNGVVVMIAAGGGGAGSDGDHGNNSAPGAGSGGAGGALGGSGWAGSANDLYGTGSGGGSGGAQTVGGSGGISNNTSSYDTCPDPDDVVLGTSGAAHEGGDSPANCTTVSTGGSWHLGGGVVADNGGGGGGGAGYYGGGGAAALWTYSGGGGGGGSSWAHADVTAPQSESGNGPSPGGQSQADFDGMAGKGGQLGDWSNWPTSTIDPEHGGGGLVVLTL